MDMPDWWTYRHALFDTGHVISIKHSSERRIDASFLYVYLHSDYNDGDDNDDDDDKDEDDDENDDGDTVDVDMHAECPQYQMSRD